MKKRLLSLLLCLMMVTTLFIGCNSSGDDSNDDNNSSSSDDKKLVLWSIATESDAFSGSYKKAIDDFKSANAGVEIDHQTFENESYKTKLKTAVSGNDLPDMFYTWGGGFTKPFVESGKVLELDSYYANYKDELPAAAVTYTTYDGKVYGSTYTTPISALYYNKKIFDENSLTAPKTFDELKTVCKTLKDKGVTPIGISAKDTWVIAMTHDNLTLKSAGPEKTLKALTADGQSYNDPDFVNSAKKLVELVDLGAFHEGAAGLSNDEASQLFYQGEVAMFVTGSWMAGSIQTDPDNPDDFDVVPYPVLGDNAKATDFMGGAVDCIMVSKETKQPDLAAKAVFEITKKISEYSYLEGAGLAVWKKDYDDSDVNPMTKKLAGFVDGATSFTMWFDTFMESKQAGEYLTLLQELFVKNITPEDFAKAMDENLNQ